MLELSILVIGKHLASYDNICSDILADPTVRLYYSHTHIPKTESQDTLFPEQLDIDCGSFPISQANFQIFTDET